MSNLEFIEAALNYLAEKSGAHYELDTYKMLEVLAQSFMGTLAENSLVELGGEVLENSYLYSELGSAG